ncbi:bax-like protein [Ophiostoma piceae UAMH 11346]|uniref:Bax-like protein n=1 Tax=Ophiostoma piceae (strain UAMH 11346) TaxID=1262450 RepID=S3C9B4_OPHP1|nr:bax-like protein [Ophiostoma piceae UAMH 11346]
MPSPEDYRLVISAGTDYDAATHVPVRVNGSEPLHLAGPGGDVWLNVRIKNFRGDGPTTSAYFDTPLHKTNDDTYGIGLWFVPAEDHAVSGEDLQWGNDFDEPIRNHLPPGFGTALRIVKWWIDPGIDGDPYADKPYLYGPAVSSFNRVHVALDAAESDSKSDSKSDKKKDNVPTTDFGLWFDEGGDDAGRAWRQDIGCPGDDGEDGEVVGKARMKWALEKGSAAKWEWRHGAGYGMDFYNGYLDFDALALRLPGFQMPLLRFWDGQQDLRYVLRNKVTGQVYLAIVFKLEKIEGRGEDEDKTDKTDEIDKTDGGTKTDEAETAVPDVSADDVD